MPLLSTEAMNESLDSDYATNSHQLALFYDDPALADDPTDVELTSTGGYARVTVAAAAWAAAAAGSKSTTNPVTFPSTTAEWPDAALYFGLYDTVEGFWRDYGPLASALEVTGAGAGPSVIPSVFYDDSVAPTSVG